MISNEDLRKATSAAKYLQVFCGSHNCKKCPFGLSYNFNGDIQYSCMFEHGLMPEEWNIEFTLQEYMNKIKQQAKRPRKKKKKAKLGI